MKADIIAHPKNHGVDELGWMNIKLIPETVQERELFASITANHRRLIDEESGGPESIIDVLSVVTDDEEIEMEIAFPK